MSANNSRGGSRGVSEESFSPERTGQRNRKRLSVPMQFVVLFAASILMMASVFLFHGDDRQPSVSMERLLDLPQVYVTLAHNSSVDEVNVAPHPGPQTFSMKNYAAKDSEPGPGILPNQVGTVVAHELHADDTSHSSIAASAANSTLSLDQAASVGSIETCFPYNSEEWLRGPRLGNADDPLLTEHHVMEMILNTPKLLSGGTLHTLLNQTICHEASRFLNWTDDGSDSRSLHFWTLRLLYLAFHVHQHKPAVREAHARQAMIGRCDTFLRDHGVQTFDYECPDTKFLIVPMGELGLGAVMRLGAVNGLIAGVATNRTVLFVNNAPAGHKSIQTPWVHASCDRRDFQCFFVSISPCVLTQNEIEQAYMLQRGEARRMFRYGLLPDAHTDDRVVAVDIVLRPQRTPETLRPNLRSLAKVIVDEIREANNRDPRLAVLDQATEHILEVEPEDTSRPYYYFGAQSKVHHAAVFYSLRPKPTKAVVLDRLMNKVFPGDYEPELSLGLPVRASDKCLMESECLSFPQYMKLLTQLWTKNEPLLVGAARTNVTTSIVVTTESENIYRDMTEFESEAIKRDSVPFAYRFISNDHDVRQGTGLPANFGKRNVTTDDIMMSAISSLKTQLMARFTVGNCCSNFHLLLFDFLRDGCGAARDNIGQCLQENEDPEYRVCCMWSKDNECQSKKSAKDLQKS